MNSLRAHIAVVDQDGKILMVNDRWKRFAMENGLPHTERVGPGVNYLDVCRRAKGAFSEEAQSFKGLQAVLRRSLDEFTLEYPCPFQRLTDGFCCPPCHGGQTAAGR